MPNRRWLLRFLVWLLFYAANGAFAEARETKPHFKPIPKEQPIYTAVLPAVNKLEQPQLEIPPAILEPTKPIYFPRVAQPVLEINSPKNDHPTDLPRARAPPASP